jgi:hypothetical protein
MVLAARMESISFCWIRTFRNDIQGSNTREINMDVTFNNAVKETVEVGLGEVPVVGGLLSGLVNLFWPESGTNVWGQVRADVEALLNQALDNLVYNGVYTLLNGASNIDPTGMWGVINLYEQSLTSGKNSTKTTAWVAASEIFASNVGQFKQEGYELLLLPLFAQMANMRLSLLRDGVLNGATWGWDTSFIDDIHKDLKLAIYDHVQWASEWFNKGLNQTTGWGAQNTYARGMILQAVDYAFYWPYFDPDAKNASPTLPPNTREIYSDIQGTAANEVASFPNITACSVTLNYDPAASPASSNYSIMAPAILSWNTPVRDAITSISVWVNTWINSVQVTYGQSAGPLMGVQPAPNVTPQVYSTMPITTGRGGSGDVIDWMQFVSNNNPASFSEVFGNIDGIKVATGPTPFIWTIPGEQLSSVPFIGYSQYYGFASAVIFGFRYASSYSS